MAATPVSLVANPEGVTDRAAQSGCIAAALQTARAAYARALTELLGQGSVN
jgi:hypothetical protein